MRFSTASLDKKNTMKITNSIEIRSTPEKVFYWLENPNRAMEWMDSVTKTEIIKETPNMVGTTFREYIEENGKGTEMHGKIIDFVANERLTFHLKGEFNNVKVCFILEKKGDNTKLTQHAELRFKGVIRLMVIFLGPLFKKKIMKQSQNEFSKLKLLCEQ